MNYLDGFSGYGGFHIGLERAGFHFDKVYYSEINKYAIANYSYNFPNSIYAGSIDTICTSGIITELDLFTFGWPCQDNSIAGKRKGQTAGTRSGLLYEAVKIINKFKPRNFIAENVLGLLSVNAGIDIIESLRLLTYLNESCPQYDIEMQLLNTRWVLPQNRERLYFVGYLRGSGSKQVFPIGENIAGVNERATNASTVRCLTAGGNSGGLHSGMTLIQKDYTKGNAQVGRVYEVSGIATTLNGGGGGLGANTGLYEIKTNTKSGVEVANMGDSVNYSVPGSKTRRGRVGKGVAQTLDTACYQGVIAPTNFQGNNFCNTIRTSGRGSLSDKHSWDTIRMADSNIRRLTPTECERLQGLQDDWTKYGIFDGEVKELSDTQRYRLCGNGVTADIVEMIGKKLYQNNFQS